MEFDIKPTLESIINQTKLKWIFVGGKGGVGKTTTSSSIAIQLALKYPEDHFLLISTDPAHNLSDAFCQKFGKDARPVNEIPNLSCMEIDPEAAMNDLQQQALEFNNDSNNPFKSIMNDMTSSIPGIDEALSFMEILKQIENQKLMSSEEDKPDEHEQKESKKVKVFRTIIFDTAPTGHTLRFLQLPATLLKFFTRFQSMSKKFGAVLSSLSDGDIGDLFDKLDHLQSSVQKVRKQFKDPELTTFVCVCISEFLSLYETERMVQELMYNEMDVNSIVVNQLVFAEGDKDTCKRCASRWKMQKKYLDQMQDLYDEFHLVKMPLLFNEVRGVENLKKFSNFLVTPFDPSKDFESLNIKDVL